MMFRDKANLTCSLARSIDDEMKLDEWVACQGLRQGIAGVVVANRPDKDAARTEPYKVARDVARAANHDFRSLDRDHRRRRLRRNAGNLAVNELVQHQVADAENGLLGQGGEVFVEIGRAHV